MDKYFTNKKYKNGEIISMVITDLYNNNNYNNILFVRTPTTGNWLDNLFINKEKITRILYDTNTTKNYKYYKYYKYHKTTTMIEHFDLEKTLKVANLKYDLICVDPFHEYTNSKTDFNILSSFLTDNGIMICHDCFPSNKLRASPKFKYGNWCGETYVAFIEFAYNNSNYFYSILNIDTGIGIISKLPYLNLYPLKNNFNIQKQEQLLLYHKNNDDLTYTYFYENCRDIMNMIDIT